MIKIKIDVLTCCLLNCYVWTYLASYFKAKRVEKMNCRKEPERWKSPREMKTSTVKMGIAANQRSYQWPSEMLTRP